MAVPNWVFPSFECRLDPDFSGGGMPRPDIPRLSGKVSSPLSHGSFGLSSLIVRFPPNFVRQLSIKARRNCSNIGVAQVIAASWSNNQPPASASAAAAAFDAAASASTTVPSVEIPTVEGQVAVGEIGGNGSVNGSVQFEGLPNVHKPSFLTYDGSVAIHAGMEGDDEFKRVPEIGGEAAETSASDRKASSVAGPDRVQGLDGREVKGRRRRAEHVFF